jgi:hypothetical protein
MTDNHQKFADHVEAMLREGGEASRVRLEKIAADQFGITDRTEVKELTELAIVREARRLAHAPGTVRERYDSIVALYERQAVLSFRTSQSMLLQQYSTPAPIGYLAGVFAGLPELHIKGGYAYEPSAGNGLLTIAARPECVYVNEIDELRNSNLKTQRYANVWNRDATLPYIDIQKAFVAIITNPPFGRVDESVKWDGYAIQSLEMIMALRALDCMTNDGRAAIIIGGHTSWDARGRIQAGKNRIFFNYLYHHYYVADVIPVDGHKLCSRQGTAFDTRLILIAGRKANPAEAAPLKGDGLEHEVVDTFGALYDRVMRAMARVNPNTPKGNKSPDEFLLTRTRATALRLRMLMETEMMDTNNDNLGMSMEDARYPSTDKTFKWSDTAARYNFNAEGETTSRALFENWDVEEESEDGVRVLDYIVNSKVGDIWQGRVDRLVCVKDGDVPVEDYGLGIYMPTQIEEWYAIEKLLWEKKEFDVLYKKKHPTRRRLRPGGALWREFYGKHEHNGETETRFDGFLLSATPGDRWSDDELDIVCTVGGAIPFDKDFLWGLGMAYKPASDAARSLEVDVPDSMAFETHEALARIQGYVGGDVDNFVRHRLGYDTLGDLANALSAEQVDAVAMAIYNIEGRGQGMIIGDQTGIGKGRIAAAMIRYGVHQGKRPLFLTEKPNLFSDLYRDLVAIGSSDLVPFIVNGREAKTDIKNEEGQVVHTALSAQEQERIFKSNQLPGNVHFAVATYSQFNSPETKPLKPAWLEAVATNNILILDEAHNSSGSSNTGAFLKGVVASAEGVVFLSATFAKRPDNLPIYAMKTCMRDAALSDDALSDAVTRGGVALQEVVSSQLVAQGQMLRRERSYEGIEVNYLTLTDQADAHRATADQVTTIIRDIIEFQSDYVTPAIEAMDSAAAKEGKELEGRKGTSKAGVDNNPYFSKVFMVVNQMLFAIKAEAVAERAIMRLRQGKKAVIAFSSTMGAFLETMETAQGITAGDGDTISADFTEVLRRGLDGVMRYTVKDVNGNPTYASLTPADLSPQGQQVYTEILERIGTASTGLCISPIDVLIDKIEAAGYKVAEVTGRKVKLELSKAGHGRVDSQRVDAAAHLRRHTQTRPEDLNGVEGPQIEEGRMREADDTKNPKGWFPDEVVDYIAPFTGIVRARKRENTNDAFRRFNQNEVDVLLINQSGSTGASAHAVPNPKVPASEVRQRCMIVLQAELDINTEVQKRGRINRTGQIMKPIYDYLSSAIPAEQRLMMMLQKKLKSLDANTASNQRNSSAILDVPDFLNKYGDKIVAEYLEENPALDEALGQPLATSKENAAHKVSGRVAVLATADQERFYTDIAERYTNLIDYLKQAGEYDLEVEAMNLQAETLSSKVVAVGSGGGSPFGTDVTLEVCEVNRLKKPYKGAEVIAMLHESLAGRTPKLAMEELSAAHDMAAGAKLAEEMRALDARLDKALSEIEESPKYIEIEDPEVKDAVLRTLKGKLEEERREKMDALRTKSRNHRLFVDQCIEFFTIGRQIQVPAITLGEGMAYERGVFLGFKQAKGKNPFAPSNMRLRFALASGSKYLELPASMMDKISPVMVATQQARLPYVVNAYADGTVSINPDFENDWDESTRGAQSSRTTRHIITGNLLQAMGSYTGGRLVAYTLLSGGEAKGLLMPEGWANKTKDGAGETLIVPIGKALNIIRALHSGDTVKCTNGLIIQKQYDGFKLYTPASKAGGGHIFLDAVLQEHVNDGIWEKTSDKMIAWLPDENLPAFLGDLDRRHPGTITTYTRNLAMVKDLPGVSSGGASKAIVPPPPAPREKPAPPADDFSFTRTRALALRLKMKMEMEMMDV